MLCCYEGKMRVLVNRSAPAMGSPSIPQSESAESTTRSRSSSTSDENSIIPAVKRPIKNKAEIIRICENLAVRRNRDNLEKYLRKVPKEMIKTVDAVAYARATLLFIKNHHRRLRELLRSRPFHKKYWKGLLDMWYRSYYKTNNVTMADEDEHQRKLIRKRNQPPLKIWEGVRKYNDFKKGSQAILISFFNHNQYPSRAEKAELANMTGFTVAQVKNWFKNRRQRINKKLVNSHVIDAFTRKFRKNVRVVDEEEDTMDDDEVEEEELEDKIEEEEEEVIGEQKESTMEEENFNKEDTTYPLLDENAELDAYYDELEVHHEEIVEEEFVSVFDSPEDWDVRCAFGHREKLIGTPEELAANEKIFYNEVENWKEHLNFDPHKLYCKCDECASEDEIVTDEEKSSLELNVIEDDMELPQLNDWDYE